MKGVLFFVIGLIVAIFLFKGLFSGIGDISTSSSPLRNTSPAPKNKDIQNVFVAEQYHFQIKQPKSLSEYSSGLLERTESDRSTCERFCSEQSADSYLERGYKMYNKVPDRKPHPYLDNCYCTGYTAFLEKND